MDDEDGGNVRLRLYVSGMTPQGVRAVQNIRRICEEHLADRSILEVFDLHQHPEISRSLVTVTPMLVYDGPGASVRLIGDLSDLRLVLAGLGLVGDLPENRRNEAAGPSEILTGEVDTVIDETPEPALAVLQERGLDPYRTFVETMNEGAVVIDRAGLILFCNRRFASIIGARMETIPGSSFLDFICDHDRLLFSALREGGAGGASAGDLQMVSTGGRLVPVHLSLIPYRIGETAGVGIVVTDLTALRQNWAFLSSEHLAHSILEQAADPIVVTDAGQVIIRANTAAVEMAGGNPLRAPFDAVFPLFQMNAGREVPFSPATISCAGERLLGTEVLFRRPDGALNSLLISAAPVIGMPGESPGCVVVMTDITAQKQVEGELRRTLDDLAHSNQDLQQFAYLASHDLQEPLRMVASYLQLLERKYRDRLDPDARLFIGYAVEGANRMQQQINDLLAYSRVTSRGKPLKPVSAEEALTAALGPLALKIEETGARITRHLLPMVRADLPQLVQVFSNLLDNALTFRRTGVVPEVEISAEERDGWVIFSVQDNGIGIDSEFYQRIFQMFQRLHSREEYPGTGIGLAICQRIVERHHGRIWVTSIIGRGSTFCFSIPGIHSRPDELRSREIG